MGDNCALKNDTRWSLVAAMVLGLNSRPEPLLQTQSRVLFRVLTWGTNERLKLQAALNNYLFSDHSKLWQHWTNDIYDQSMKLWLLEHLVIMWFKLCPFAHPVLHLSTPATHLPLADVCCLLPPAGPGSRSCVKVWPQDMHGECGRAMEPSLPKGHC